MRQGTGLSALLVATLMLATACVPARAPILAARPAAVPCKDCTTIPIPTELVASLGARIADLKARGADCQAEAEVLDRALAGGHITIRPYMWRVGPNLASAQGESTGELTIAREIDSLNVGVRGLDDVLKSAEHEAVHIALRIPSGERVGEALVDEHVLACRPQSRKLH